VSNQDYTGYAAGSQSGIEGRLQCGNSIWTTAGIRFKKFNGTIGDKHSYLELYATDGYSNKVGLVVQPDGEVTKERLPCFSVYKYDNANQVSSGVYVFNTVVHNNGSHYNSSNGRFTAPVAGYYFFYFTLQGYGGTGSGRHVRIQLNGTDYWNNGTNTPYYDESAGSHHNWMMGQGVQMAASDYVTVVSNQGMRGMQSGFSGFLVG
jgi:hypothetical protein